MSSVLEAHIAIDGLITNNTDYIKWVSYSNIINVESSEVDTIHFAIYRQAHSDGNVDEKMIMLLSLGSGGPYAPTSVSDFARTYSLGTSSDNNDASQFRRYSAWLSYRNKLILGFTKDEKNHYYMIAKRSFYHYYSCYGFCSECGLLRCSPVWCICGYKQLSDGWTSNNHQLDDFIKKSQLQTNSANEAYLEWIPFDSIADRGFSVYLTSIPVTAYRRIQLIPLEINDKTDDSYYDKLCDEHPDILDKDVWITIGFTCDASQQKYYLIKDRGDIGICMACTYRLEPKITAFCYRCKAPSPPDWTTGNKSLDSFIMESWRNTTAKYDAYLRWIEYSLLKNVQEMTSLRHRCTHIADWLEPVTNQPVRVTLKKIVDGQDAQSFDFYQLITGYPQILIPDNIWVTGITQKPSTNEYYLVFYYEMRAILNRLIHIGGAVVCMPYTDFDEIKEIGSGGYGTVYTAKYRNNPVRDIPELVVLKCFKNFDEASELFISEFRNHAKCSDQGFLEIYGFTQNPATEEYIVVMQYANDGSLLSFLDRNINNMTWRMKYECLLDIAFHLSKIHLTELVHCDLHGGNIVLQDIEGNSHTSHPLICDLGLSRSVKSCRSSSAIQGVLPFIAPEVFHTRKFTKKSDIYSFGMIMYLMANGEPPFRDREFDEDLVRDIMNGLRPTMPDSAPEKYKKLAEMYCDADPDKRPHLWMINELAVEALDDKSDVWKAIYHKDVKPLSRLEKENKYSSKILPTENLPEPRRRY